ncbi:MAG: glycosyltransferase family 2 protein [Clostridia bacterium]|nr:glycosyltransferase family 2 protein [Clostridia bacterium]
MPRFSFIVPVYNCRQYLEECVRSILAQTVSDFEILLVDDGSTDGSGELCDCFADAEERICSFHKKNGGAGSARNAGIDNARGDNLIFIDADDIIDDTFLESSLPFLRDEAMLNIGISYDTYDNDRVVQSIGLGFREMKRYGSKQIRNELMDLFANNCLSSSCSKVIPRKTIDESGARFNEKLTVYEDLEFVLKCLKNVSEFVAVPCYAYHYRIQKDKSKLLSRVPDIRYLDFVIMQLDLAVRGLFAVDDEVSLPLAGQLVLTSILDLLSAEIFRDRVGSFTELKQTALEICDMPSFGRLTLSNERLVESGAVQLKLVREKQFFKLELWRIKKKIRRWLYKLANDLLVLFGIKKERNLG